MQHDICIDDDMTMNATNGHILFLSEIDGMPEVAQYSMNDGRIRT